MKTVSVALDAHMSGEVTTLARCWRVSRQDGVEFFFTDHDVDITFDGEDYIAMTGFSATAIATNATLNVDNLSVAGVLTDDSIKDEDMVAGLFDYAEVRIFIINWADTSEGILKMRRGWFGEVVKSPTTGEFTAELRGMTQPLQQTIGELYGPECRADLGDHRCKIPIDPAIVQRDTAYATGDYAKVSTDPGADGYAVYENVIYKCVSGGVTATVAPTYDTGIGNETIDGGGAAGGTVGNFTFSGQPADASFIKVDEQQYTFKTVLTGADDEVHIGANLNATINNVIAAIAGTGTPGTDYDADIAPNTAVSATNVGGTVLRIELADLSIPGAQIALSEFAAAITLDVTTLSADSNAAVFEAQEAWSRAFEVTGVTDHYTFAIDVDDVRAVDNWFSGGVVVFNDGPNHDRAFEVKSWVNSGGVVNLFLPTGFEITVGEVGHIYPGCDKRLETCRDRFANLLNMRAEPYLPGRDQAFDYPDAK